MACSRIVTIISIVSHFLGCVGELERAKGIEPSYAAWEAAVLPLNYARGIRKVFSRPIGRLYSLTEVLTHPDARGNHPLLSVRLLDRGIGSFPCGRVLNVFGD